MTNAEIMRENIMDMLGVEQHILQSIERQTRDERVRKFTSAYELLHRIESVLNSHVNILEHHLSMTNGGYETKLKKVASTLMGSVSGLYGKIRNEEPVSRNLRDDYTALNLATVSYGMLHTTALALHETEIAETAYRHMAELTPFVVQISNLLPFILAKELSEEGKIEDASVAQVALRDIQRAWSDEVIRF
jgi:hypothetical protein